MRSKGWYGDSWAELVMNIGTWLCFFGLGAFAGPALGNTTVSAILLVGIAVGVAGQLTWATQRRGVDHA